MGQEENEKETKKEKKDEEMTSGKFQHTDTLKCWFLQLAPKLSGILLSILYSIYNALWELAVDICMGCLPTSWQILREATGSFRVLWTKNITYKTPCNLFHFLLHIFYGSHIHFPLVHLSSGRGHNIFFVCVNSTFFIFFFKSNFKVFNK